MRARRALSRHALSRHALSRHTLSRDTRSSHCHRPCFCCSAVASVPSAALSSWPARPCRLVSARWYAVSEVVLAVPSLWRGAIPVSERVR